MVLEETLESPLDCKEVQPVHPKGNQSWVFVGRTDVEAETPILWPPDAKSYFSIPSLLTFISASVWEAFCDEFLPWCSVQFSSVDQSCLTLCDPLDYSNPGLPVHHQLLEFTQTHVHRVSDAIQPSHPLSSPSPPVFNLSQHQSLFQ